MRADVMKLPGAVSEPLPDYVEIIPSHIAEAVDARYKALLSKQKIADKAFFLPKESLCVVPVIGNIYPDQHAEEIVNFLQNYIGCKWYAWVDDMDGYAKFLLSNSHVLFEWIAMNINVGEVIAMSEHEDFFIIFDSYMNYSTYAFDRKFEKIFFEKTCEKKIFTEDFEYFLNSNEGGFGEEDSTFIKKYYLPFFARESSEDNSL